MVNGEEIFTFSCHLPIMSFEKRGKEGKFTFCNGNLISSNVKIEHLHSFHDTESWEFVNGVIVEGISVMSNWQSNFVNYFHFEL